MGAHKYVAIIEQDCDAENPRSWGHFGHMICWHNRYDLGDEECADAARYYSPGEWRRVLAERYDSTLNDRLAYWSSGNGWQRIVNSVEHDDIYRTKAHRRYNDIKDRAVEQVLERCVIMLPLYLYDHSGITMNTTGFSCPWDSGQVGYIYVTLDEVRHEYQVQRVTRRVREKVIEQLTAEVALYDTYLRGDYYLFIIEDEDGNTLDACGGFNGANPAENGMLDAASQEYHQALLDAYAEM